MDHKKIKNSIINFSILIYGIIFVFTNTACTHLPVDHYNPYDHVYENGAYKIALAPVEKTPEGELLLKWSDITSISTPVRNSAIDTFSANQNFILRTAAGQIFSATDLTSIENGQLIGSSLSVAEKKTGVSKNSGQLIWTGTGANQKMQFVIEISFTDSVGSGVLHSNIVEFTP